jgi:hypothetical protein
MNPLAEGIGFKKKAAALALLLVAVLWGWGEKKINGGLGGVGLEPGSGWVRRIPLAGMDFFRVAPFSRDSADGPGTRSPNDSSRNLALINY